MPNDDDDHNHDHDTPHLTKMDRLWHIVTGNGDPRDGLVFKVEDMRKAVERINENAKEFRLLLRTILGGVIVGVSVLIIKGI